MNRADETLIAYFAGRKLPPEGYFQISDWESTFNIQKTVELALAGLGKGDIASREVLIRIRHRLESDTKLG